jgi:hypothetical protein
LALLDSMDAKQRPAIGAKGTVAKAEANLPVALGGVARGDKQIGRAVAESSSDRSGGVVIGMGLAGLLAALLHNHQILLKFGKPCPLDNSVHGEFGARRDLLNHERLLSTGDAEGVFRVEAGQDSPERVGVGIFVECTSELMDLSDELSRGFGRRGHEAGEGGHAGGEFGSDPGQPLLAVDQHAGLSLLMLRDERVDDHSPGWIRQRGLRDDDSVVAGRCLGRGWQHAPNQSGQQAGNCLSESEKGRHVQRLHKGGCGRGLRVRALRVSGCGRTNPQTP